MEPMTSGGADAVRLRRRLTAGIKESLRELSVQLALLNHQVGAQVSMRDVDFSCLDLIKRHGPLSPTELAGGQVCIPPRSRALSTGFNAPAG